MKTLTSILAALALSASFAAAEDKKPEAGAEKPKRDPAELFKKLDSNNDGKVSLEEWKASPMGKKDAAKAEEMFKSKDKDNDGSLTLDEFKAGGHAKKNK